jgi:hypothetical protein
VLEAASDIQQIQKLTKSEVECGDDACSIRKTQDLSPGEAEDSVDDFPIGHRGSLTVVFKNVLVVPSEGNQRHKKKERNLARWEFDSLKSQASTRKNRRILTVKKNKKM